MQSSLQKGLLLAILSAVSFGATTPLVAYASRGLGSAPTAALLYLGACLSALLLGGARAKSGAPLSRGQLPRLLLVALFGAALAPVLLVWGLQRTGGTVGSLLLTLEAVFTALLARVFYQEPLGGRVIAALVLMVLGGMLLSLGTSVQTSWSLWGILAVTAATLSWGFDNTLTRVLAEQDPLQVVAAKSSLGALITGMLSLLLHEKVPSLVATLLLLGCGATGYGLSLRLYLLAQRQIGAARTGSIFAIAPFVGAVLSWLCGDRVGGEQILYVGILFALGVYLHITEHHEHHHLHPAVVHEHMHRHDDGHHTHTHEPPVIGEHSHVHAHETLAHSHIHSPDLHHDHAH